jgi:hypothetical protein
MTSVVTATALTVYVWYKRPRPQLETQEGVELLSQTGQDQEGKMRSVKACCPKYAYFIPCGVGMGGCIINNIISMNGALADHAWGQCLNITQVACSALESSSYSLSVANYVIEGVIVTVMLGTSTLVALKVRNSCCFTGKQLVE